MGVYGSFLEFFGELLERQEFYSQAPAESGGYRKKKSIGTFRVVFQTDSLRELTRNGGRWVGLDTKEVIVFWCARSVAVGAFFEPQRREGVYRVEGVLDYNKEGGFYSYVCAKVTGADGRQTDKLPLRRGTF